jgi:TonB family protein
MTLFLDSVIKSSLLLLVTFATVWLLRRSSAATRHFVLAAGLTCAALSPALALAVPAWRVEFPMPAAARTSSGVVVANQVSTETIDGASSQAAATTTPALASPARLPAFTGRQMLALWGVGVAAALLSLFAGFARLGWIARRSEPAAHKGWLDVLSHVAARHGLSRMPRLLQSRHPSLLVTWGLMQPTVLLPVSAPEWRRDRMRVVLDHELAHIARHDWVMQMGAELLRCVYWFNPLVWVACRRLRQESEQACDDRVLGMGHAGPAYAAHLLDLARAFRSSDRVWIPAVAIARPSSLERRVAAMLTSDVNRQPVSPRIALAIVLLLLAVTLPIASLDAFAQTRYATVSGTVTDQGGGVLINATVSLTNVQTSAKFQVRTNRTGFFEITPLPAGEYELAVEVESGPFMAVKETIILGVGESLQRNVSLNISNVQETISVTSASDGPRLPGINEIPKPATRKPCPDPSVGGCINPPLKVKDVRPIYPVAAREAGVNGVVMLQGVIDVEGRMKDLRVVSSPHPALDQAAVDAVSQWEFAPTLLNGKPIETPIHTGVYFDVEAPKPPQRP